MPRPKTYATPSPIATVFHFTGQLMTAALLILCAVALTIWDRQTIK